MITTVDLKDTSAGLFWFKAKLHNENVTPDVFKALEHRGYNIIEGYKEEHLLFFPHDPDIYTLSTRSSKRFHEYDLHREIYPNDIIGNCNDPITELKL